MNARGIPAQWQFAVFLSLLCLVLFTGMWGASQLGFSAVAKGLNVLLLFSLFVGLFFLVTIVIVMVAQLTRKLLDLYLSR